MYPRTRDQPGPEDLNEVPIEPIATDSGIVEDIEQDHIIIRDEKEVVASIEKEPEAVKSQIENPQEQPATELHEPSSTTREQSVELDVMQSLMQSVHEGAREEDKESAPRSSETPRIDKKRLEGMPRPPNYKTVPCRLYHSSVGCARGDFCHFIHDPDYAGKDLPSELWKNKRRKHEPGPFFGPPFSPRLPMHMPMMPYFGQLPMRMPNFPPIPPPGYMPFSRSPEHGHSSSSHGRSHGSKK